MKVPRWEREPVYWGWLEQVRWEQKNVEDSLST